MIPTIFRYSSKRLDTTVNHVFQADVFDFVLLKNGSFKSKEKLLFWKCNYNDISEDWEVISQNLFCALSTCSVY